MAGDAVQGWPIACTMTEVAQYLVVLSLQRPWMPRFGTMRCCRSERQEWTPLRDGMTNGAGTSKDFSCLAYMPVVMASKTARPVAVTYVVGISRPVDLHRCKDISAVNGENGFNGLADQILLISDDIWKILAVVVFDKLPDGFIYVLPIVIFFY